MGKGKQSGTNNYIFRREGRKLIRRQRSVHKGCHNTVVSKTEENQYDQKCINKSECNYTMSYWDCRMRECLKAFDFCRENFKFILSMLFCNVFWSNSVSVKIIFSTEAIHRLITEHLWDVTYPLITCNSLKKLITNSYWNQWKLWILPLWIDFYLKKMLLSTVTFTATTVNVCGRNL